MIIIHIEITPRHRAKEFLDKLHSKLENLLFSIIQKLPEKLIPSFLMDWLDRYTTRRIEELQRQIVRQNWNKTFLEKAASEIRTGQQEQEKAPDKD